MSNLFNIEIIILFLIQDKFLGLVLNNMQILLNSTYYKSILGKPNFF